MSPRRKKRPSRSPLILVYLFAAAFAFYFAGRGVRGLFGVDSPSWLAWLGLGLEVVGLLAALAAVGWLGVVSVRSAMTKPR